MKFPISEELQQTVEQKPSIEAVYFTADGAHHFRVFKHGDDLYTRLQDVPEKTKSGIQIPNKWVKEPITNYKGESDHKIVDIVKREDVLKATPVRVSSNTPQILKADILSALNVTEEELTALTSKRKK